MQPAIATVHSRLCVRPCRTRLERPALVTAHVRRRSLTNSLACWRRSRLATSTCWLDIPSAAFVDSRICRASSGSTCRTRAGRSTDRVADDDATAPRTMLRRGQRLSRVGACSRSWGWFAASLALLTGGAPGAPRRLVKRARSDCRSNAPTTRRRGAKAAARVHPWSRSLVPAEVLPAMAEHLRVLETEGTAIAAMLHRRNPRRRHLERESTAGADRRASCARSRSANARHVSPIAAVTGCSSTSRNCRRRREGSRRGISRTSTASTMKRPGAASQPSRYSLVVSA